MIQENLKGHLSAFFCVIVWGSTFVVSKDLLSVLQPLQLMLIRFSIAYIFLWILYPRWSFRLIDEWKLFLMGLFANTLYCMTENYALTMTNAANVSILVSTTPIMTAVALSLLPGGERLIKNQIIGFGVAFAGVVLVVFNGKGSFELSIGGDMLALLSALSWVVYGIMLRKWGGKFESLLITRKLMFYGILTIIPVLVVLDDPVNLSALIKPDNIFKLLYLGVVASGLCYLSWNMAVERLGVL